jgi:hypothetical protein
MAATTALPRRLRQAEIAPLGRLAEQGQNRADGRGLQKGHRALFAHPQAALERDVPDPPPQPCKRRGLIA